MTTIKFNNLSANARSLVQQMAATGGQVYARKKGRGYTIEQFTEPPLDGWLLVTDVTAAEPESSQAEAAASGGFELVPLDLIDPNPYQPRLSQDAEALESLARGLRLKRKQLPDTCGLMQVPIARKLDSGRYELAFGHRRKAAFDYNNQHHAPLPGFSLDELAEVENGVPNGIAVYDWSRMPLRVAALNDEQVYDFAARENSDREEINPIEKALSIKRAQDELGWPLTRAANAHGLSKSAGSNLVGLLRLPEAVQRLIAAGELGQRQGRELVKLMAKCDPPLTDRCIQLAHLSIEQGLIIPALKHHVELEITEQEQQRARAAHREPRYCRTCSTEREFTGAEIDRNKAVDCNGCGYNGPPEMWRKRPLPELPTEPVRFGPSARMYGHWFCDFCDSHESPGLATWATIDGQDMKVCPRCKQRLQPLALSDPNDFGIRWCPACGEHRKFSVDHIEAEDSLTCLHCGQAAATAVWLRQPPATEPEPAPSPKHLICPHCGNSVRNATGGGLVCDGCGEEWLNLRRFREDVRTVQSRGQSEIEPTPDWSDETWTCCRCNRTEPRNGDTAEWTLNQVQGFTCRQCWKGGDPPTTQTGHCPGCDHPKEFGAVLQDRPHLIVNCDSCDATNPAADWLAAATVGTAEAELSGGKLHLTLHPQPGAPPDAEPECYAVSFGQKPEARGEFDCPRCNEEQIVKVNGSAVCFGCDARWSTPADFHAEAQGQQPETTPRQRRTTLRERWSRILSRLDEMQLDEAEHWLIDFEERIKSKWA